MMSLSNFLVSGSNSDANAAPDPLSRKVQSRTLHTQEKIKKAARSLFVQYGFDGTSMGDIAEKAEVNQSLIHHHFGSKQALWNVIRDEIYEGYIQAALEFLSRDIQADIETQIKNILTMRFDFLQKHPDLTRIMAWQSLGGMPASTSSDQGASAMQKILEKLKQAQEAGQLSKQISPEMLAVVVFITTIGWFQNDYRWIFKSANLPNASLDQLYLENLTQVILKGVLA